MPEVRIPADQVFPILEENILVDGFHVVIDLSISSRFEPDSPGEHNA